MFSYDLSAYEDLIELELPSCNIDLNSLEWYRYNPRKFVNRFGCSITSLDGNDTGVPDLDSLVEYNREHGKEYQELDFKTPTKHAAPFQSFLNDLVCGRSHYLKLGAGGFFPWHRDNDLFTFRILYTIEGCGPNDLVWIQNDKVLELQNHKWYYVNTKKKHCLFSFNESVMAVFNVQISIANFKKMIKLFKIK